MSKPAYTFTSDSNTGMYRLGVDNSNSDMWSIGIVKNLHCLMVYKHDSNTILACIPFKDFTEWTKFRELVIKIDTRLPTIDKIKMKLGIEERIGWELKNFEYWDTESSFMIRDFNSNK